uniref:SOGA 1/2-like coiled-coil domain-containing protein n=1 Tax=Cyclopterus lumpus TaxID=8103 RepID=A0A8C2X0Z1_CYCLU
SSSRRLLADTHSTAMDLRCRLDHNERDWLREKAELLEMFDVERRVWECQLKDMQSKIEEVSVPEWFCLGLIHRLQSRRQPVGTNQTSTSTWFGMSHCSSVFVSQALKEIARVSEELCSYQDEIRKKSGDKRYIHLPLLRDVDDAPCDLSQIYDDLRALERETWITLSPKNTWSADRGPSKSWMADFADPECHRETKTSPGLLSEMDTAGPPIPPRSSSWGLSSPTFPDTELYIPESPMMTERKCHSPCGLADKKCSSPSIVRKFEAMLQENEGKVLIDGVVASCSVPANSECVNKGCCHNRWSCDTSKFTSSKLSTYGTVQKSFSEVNIQTAAKVSRSDSCPGVGSLKSPELQIPQIAKELPLNLLLSSLETPPAGPDLQGSRRNVMLEQKTAEFNRTLFQAEMGRGVEKQNRPAVTDDASPPREKSLPPLWTDVTTSVTGVYPEITLSLSAESARAAVSLQQPSAENKQRQMTQPRHASALPSQSDSSRPGPRMMMMNDHPWKALTLAAYPRPEGSRSNYGAVERILKNYESAARAHQSQSRPDETDSSPTNDVTSVSRSARKNFSRPARPANRRLPSRWAGPEPARRARHRARPQRTVKGPHSFAPTI